MTERKSQVKNLFFQAAKRGDQSKLQAYQEALEAGLGTRDREGNTVLHHAAAKGHLELVRWLVKEQAQDPSAQMNQVKRRYY